MSKRFMPLYITSLLVSALFSAGADEGTEETVEVLFFFNRTSGDIRRAEAAKENQTKNSNEVVTPLANRKGSNLDVAPPSEGCC